MTFRNFLLNACRVCGIVLLVFASRQVLADCRSDTASGWQMDSKCTTQFDSNGNYIESYCGLDANTISSGRYHMTCKPGVDPGTCVGSTCEDPPSCTWTGVCSSDLDCCGENVCNDNLRCGQPQGGGGIGMFQ